MYPLLFTSAFLMLMAFFSSSEMAHFKLSHLQNHLFASSMTTQESVLQESCEARFEQQEGGVRLRRTPDPTESKQEKREPKARSLQFSLARPPNNGKLNLYLLFYPPAEKYPEGFSFYETTARLLRELYGKESFFQERVRAEYQIIDGLLALKEQSKEFSYPDQLASLDLQDEELQSIFQKMIRGGGPLPHSHLSLLDFITFDTKGTQEDRKINFLFASPALLHAVIKEERAVVALLKERALLWDAIHHQENNRLLILKKDSLGRREISKRSRLILELQLEKHGIDPARYTPLFDFTLGKKGTIFYSQNPLTHTLTRQRL